MVIGDDLDPSDELVTDGGQPGLLDQLAHGGLLERLAPLDSAPGQGPATARRAVPPSDETQRAIVDHDGPDAELGPPRLNGRQRIVHDSWRLRPTTIRWATIPWASKKFLLARMPGSTTDSIEVEPTSAAALQRDDQSPTDTDAARLGPDEELVHRGDRGTQRGSGESHDHSVDLAGEHDLGHHGPELTEQGLSSPLIGQLG